MQCVHKVFVNNLNSGILLETKNSNTVVKTESKPRTARNEQLLQKEHIDQFITM